MDLLSSLVKKSYATLNLFILIVSGEGVSV